MAGVVRVNGENKIIALRLSGARAGKLVQPGMRPAQLNNNPAFNPWPMASWEEAGKIFCGEISTQCGPSLGSMLGHHYLSSAA